MKNTYNYEPRYELVWPIHVYMKPSFEILIRVFQDALNRFTPMVRWFDQLPSRLAEPRALVQTGLRAEIRLRRCRTSLMGMLLLAGTMMSPVAWAQDTGDQAAINKKKQDLARRLVRKARDASDEDIMIELIRMMGESTKKLSINFDAGPTTQAIQQNISRRLDEAIEMAIAQTRRSQSPSTQHSDKRRGHARQAKPIKSTKSAQGAEGSQHNPTQAQTAAGDTQTHTDKNRTQEIFLDARRSWGDLPQREREEIIQGASERYLRRYKAWIERYYRALQEAKY